MYEKIQFLNTHLDPVVGLLLFSILFRHALVVAGQQWIKTYAHTMSAILLPMITYAITSVISGNIALSLGMVGALSIVRFRNPVKSPFELVVYFLLITCGIAASVNTDWLLLITVISIGPLLGMKIIDASLKKITGKNLFQISFSEGNELPTISIMSSSSIDELLPHSGLVSYTSDNSEFEYVIASRDKTDLLALVNIYGADQRVTNVRFLTY